MQENIKCPKCGSTDFTLLENNRYQCRNCETFFTLEKIPASNEMPIDPAQKKNIIIGVVFMLAVFAYGMWSLNSPSGNDRHATQQEMMENAEENEVATKYSETIESFLAVPGKTGAEIWCVKRRTSSNLKDVEYRLSIEAPRTHKEIYTRPVINNMTWNQSFERDYQVSPIKKAGSRCWLIIGEKEIVGYDIQSRQKTVENLTLVTQFHQFSEGISRVQDLNNISGFKVTSQEGFTYYYLPEENKVLTEVEYDNVRRNENINNTSWAFQTQYVFSAGAPQQLYKLVRRQQNLRMRKIFPEEVQNIINDESLWYRKMFNVVSIEEFTPGEKYYNANVLFYDNEYCVFISTAEADEKSQLMVQCLDKHRKLVWSIPGEEVTEFKDFLKNNKADAFRVQGELILQIPYQAVIAVDMRDGKINWKYKNQVSA